MRSSARNATLEEQFANWLQESGYRWPDGNLSTSHVSGLCRGRFGKILIPHLLECVKPAPIVREIRDVLRRAAETDSLKQRALSAKLRREELAPKVAPLETEYEQLLLLYQHQADLVAMMCREVVEQEAIASSVQYGISNENLRAAAMRAARQRLQAMQVTLQHLHSKLQNVITQAKQRIALKHVCSTHLTAKDTDRQAQVVEGQVLQLWEASRQQVQLKQQGLLQASTTCPNNSTAIETPRGSAFLQQLALLTQHCPAAALEALTRIIRHQSARLLSMEEAAVAQQESGTNDVAKPQEKAWMPEVDMNLKSCHQESWRDLVDMEEAEAAARAAEEKMAALQLTPGQEAVMELQLKVAKLAARKAELESELQQQRQRLGVMKAADSEAAHLQKQLQQTTATDILLLSASRALFQSATTGIKDFVTMKERQLAFMRTAQLLCQQVSQSLQYAIHAVGREVVCARELPMELLNPRRLFDSSQSKALGVALSTAPSNLQRLRLAVHALPGGGAGSAATGGAKRLNSMATASGATPRTAVPPVRSMNQDSVALEVVKAAAVVDPVLPLCCPAVITSTLLERHARHLISSSELHSWQAQADADAARLEVAEGSVAGAEKAHGSYNTQRAPALLLEIQKALAAGRKAVDHTSGPAMEALQDLLTCPAVHAAPWQLFEGKSASQWVVEIKEARLG